MKAGGGLTFSLAPVRHATSSSSVLYKLGEGAALGGKRTPVLTGLMCELTCTSTTVVEVISLLASLRPVQSIAEKKQIAPARNDRPALASMTFLTVQVMETPPLQPRWLKECEGPHQ